MNTNITRKTYRDLLCVSLLILISSKTTNAIEFLITDNTTTKVAYTGKTSVGDTGLDQTPTLYVYITYTNAEAADPTTGIAGFLNGSLLIGSSTPTSAYIASDADVSSVNELDSFGNGWAITRVPATGTGGTGSSSQVEYQYFGQTDDGGGTFVYALNNTWDGTNPSIMNYLEIASFKLTIDTSQTNTSSTISVSRDGLAWSPYANSYNSGSNVITPASFGITISVPEPSTYATAALACAALGGVALKKRRAKLVESA